MIKPLAIAIAAGTLALGAASSSQALDLGAGFSASANVALTSNYMWRGFSQTRNGVALQGGVDLAHSSGLFIGTWASNVDFKATPGADIEHDIYIGYGFTVGPVEIGLLYNAFTYPSEKGLDFSETGISLSAYGLTVGYDYSSDFPMVGNATGTVDDSSTSHYYASYSYELPEGYTVDATVGRYDFKEAGFVGSEDDKYTYYSVGVSKSWKGIDFSLAYTDSNIDKDNCAGYTGGKEYCGDAFVFTVSKTFE